MIRKSMSEAEVLALTKPCSCSACVNGCMFGSGFLAEKDKERIALYLNITTKELEQKYLEKTAPYGKEIWRPKINRGSRGFGPCIFLKEGKCSIHPVKPLECKIAMPCSKQGEKLIQWFLLNHAIADNELGRMGWKEYLKEHEPIEGGELKQDKEKAGLND